MTGIKNVLYGLLICLGITPALAQGTISATVESMSGSREVPPNSSMGVAYVFQMDLNPDNTLSYSMSFSAIEGNFIEGEIHGPADRQHNGPAIFLLAGDGIDHLFGTTPQLSPVQRDEFLNDLWYINIFTTSYPQGEIRGQIIASAAVPEPSVGALLVLAIAAVGVGLRKRRGDTKLVR